MLLIGYCRELRDQSGRRLTILFFVMGGVKRMARSIGYCRIVGVKIGEIGDSLSK